MNGNDSWTAAGAAKEVGEPYIGPMEEAPEYHRYNLNIKRGYRINYNTWKSTVWSLFQCHNETVNVWTHFTGFLASIVGIFILICNYHIVRVKEVQAASALQLAQVEEGDVEGFDLGLIYSQRAEFNLLYATLRHSWDSYFEADPLLLAEQAQELELKIRRAELCTKWPLLAF